MTKEQPVSWEGEFPTQMEKDWAFIKHLAQVADEHCPDSGIAHQAEPAIEFIEKFISQQRKEEREKVIDEFIFIREEGERHLADDIIEMIILQSTCSHDSFYWNKEKCICEQCFKVLSALTEPS